ncbi:protein spinster homolog 1 isoform X2 [Aplysia californica]|nr:protein spinster homolog 1 isoform X2 [Aplysia californica]XP_005094598.1 protein spinster homolog 1 isoform X2 [Aplysia californica]XP_035824694.1 protein spinster homolog 1 isoform X2 [Aplysia californica]
MDGKEDEPLLPQDKEETSSSGCCEPWWRHVRPYSLYVLLVLLLAYLFNQLDRYMLAITITPLAQEVQFGDKACFVNKSVPDYGEPLACNGTDMMQCESVLNPNGTEYCRWDYNGQGWDYQILAGPVFILIYTFSGIFIGFAADQYNRKLLLAFCLAFWSAMTLLTGFVKEYWQLAILRFALGLGEAGCTPFAASLIADYFTEATRGTALGIYNFGIYFGYGLAYAVGNFITVANINGQGWRWAFILPGIPGIALGVLIAFTVREPSRTSKSGEAQRVGGVDDRETTRGSACSRLLTLLKSFTSPSLLLLCLAGSIRNAGGYVWAYNTQPYFDAINVPKETTGSYMSWIPLVSGSLGVLWGGFISDRIVKRRGLYARVIVLVASQFLAAPFAAGALFLDVPWAFFSLIPANIIGEMWVGVTLAVGVELVPSEIRTSAVALYLFIISNIGGNVPLLVPPIQEAFEGDGYSKADALRGALYILYPGLFALSGFLFLLTMFVVKRDQRRAQYRSLVNSSDD